MKTSLFFRLLQVLTYLAWKVFPVEDFCRDIRHTRRIVFSKIRVSSSTVVEGDIKKMKIEFGQLLLVTATTVGGVGIQPGTAQWSVIAEDADGGDRSGDFTLTPSPDNELECRIQHSGTSESTAVVRLQADGDRDTDEEAIVVGTLAIVVDEPNVTAFELSASVVTE